MGGNQETNHEVGDFPLYRPLAPSDGHLCYSVSLADLVNPELADLDCL